jgi:hypothetical protein
MAKTSGAHSSSCRMQRMLHDRRVCMCSHVVLRNRDVSFAFAVTAKLPMRLIN